MKNDYELTRRELPLKINDGKFISEVSNLARQTNVSLRSMQMGQIRREGNLEVLPVKITFTADFFSMLKFFEALDKADRFILNRSFGVNKANNRLECSLNVEIFALPDGK